MGAYAVMFLRMTGSLLARKKSGSCRLYFGNYIQSALLQVYIFVILNNKFLSLYFSLQDATD